MKEATKIYQVGPSEVRAVYKISLAIESGDYLAVVGHSGSGKSTLLRLIGAMEAPTEGEVYLNGLSTSEATAGELADLRAGTVGFVFQDYRLLPQPVSYTHLDHDNNAAGRVKTGFKNILLPLRRKGIAAVVGADFSYYGIRLRAMVLQLLLGGSLGFFAWMAGSAAGKHVTPTRLGELIFCLLYTSRCV